MDKQNALKLIKELINQSLKAGIFQNVETAVAVAQAFEILSKEENN